MVNVITRKHKFLQNKGADYLRDNSTADQRLCFHYIDSAISNPKSEISSLKPQGSHRPGKVLEFDLGPGISK